MDKKQDKILRTFLGLFSSVALFHEMVLPWILAIVTNAPRSLQVNDIWMLCPVGILSLLFRRSSFERLGEVILGLVCTHAVYEGVHFYTNSQTGWTGFHGVLSSVPLGAISLVFLSARNRFRFSLLGGIIGIAMTKLSGGV